MPRINQQFSLIQDPPKSSILSPSSPSSRRPQEVSSMESPPMMTRSMCSGECPSDSLTGQRWRKKSGKTTPSAPVDHHYHHEHHSHHHQHYHKSPYMVEPRKGLAEMSDDNDDDMEETQRRITKRRLVGGGDDDDSSDEEITLIRRTTNKIMTSIEISSRKMNSVHPSVTKLAFISLLLPISVFLFSWYYYDYSPAIFSPFQHQTPQQAALLSSVSSSSLPTSTSPTGQPLPSSPFSPPITPSSNSQSFCNLTSSPSCPSQEEIVILNKRLDKLEQLVLKLTNENTKGTKFINSVNEKVSILDRENRKNFASIDERFDLIAQKIEDAIEVNIKVAKSQETPTVEGIGEMIKQAIYLYDSDKTGKADYALESSGGSIVPSRCSETYDPHGIKYSVWGIPIWFTSNSPRTMIQASMAPGECWAFPGSMGNVTIKLSARIIPTEFSYEHIAKEISRDGNISSAPKALQIRGLRDENDFDGVLLGNYIYQDNDRPLQHFQVQNNKARPFNYITLIVLSNHGHNEYTCLYRFRVHGHKAE